MTSRPGLLVSALLIAGGCGSAAPRLSGPHGDGAAGTSGPSEGGAGTGGAGTGGAGTGGAGTGGGPDGGVPEAGASVADWAPIRHLTSYEYQHAVQDLLGLDAQAGSTVQPDDLELSDLGTFDVLSAGTVTNARYEQWFVAAESLTTAVFADPALRARIVTGCPGLRDSDTPCLKMMIGAFGLRAWRRPLTADETNELVDVAAAAVKEGATFDEALQRIVMAVLSSAPFLYRMEIDADPAAKAPRALTAYELAARLSFLLWSSGPDARLLQLAGDGTLLRADVLRGEVDRMIDDARAVAFVESFGGSWLGARELVTKGLAVTDRKSITGELILYFNEFLRGNRGFDEFPKADFNYVDLNLAMLYGLPTVGRTDTLQRVEVTTDARRGYVGLAAALSVASTPDRSSPTRRGKWLLSRLLCAPPEAPPAGTPDGPRALAFGETNRSRVDAIRMNVACAGCHNEMDGMGMALEAFDASGAEHPAAGSQVDDRGWLADGTPIVGEPALADAIARDPRFLPCVARQAMRFALNRELDDGDQPSIDNVVARWKSGVPTLRALLEEIVLDDSFRMRRPEGTP